MRLKKILTVLVSALFFSGAAVAVASCGGDKGDPNKATVTFDVNTEHETNVIKDKEVDTKKGKWLQSFKVYDEDGKALKAKTV